MLKWHIYRNNYLMGIAKSKHDAIKRLEILLARLLNNPSDIIEKTYIIAGEYQARREHIK